MTRPLTPDTRFVPCAKAAFAGLATSYATAFWIQNLRHLQPASSPSCPVFQVLHIDPNLGGMITAGLK